jgi:hypothetical protein
MSNTIRIILCILYLTIIVCNISQIYCQNNTNQVFGSLDIETPPIDFDKVPYGITGPSKYNLFIIEN